VSGIAVAGVATQGQAGPATSLRWDTTASVLSWGGNAPGSIQVGPADSRFVAWLQRLSFPLVVHRSVLPGGSWELSPGRATPRGWLRSKGAALEGLRGAPADQEGMIGLLLTGRLDVPSDVDWIRTRLLYDEAPDQEPVQPIGRSVLVVRTQAVRRP